MTRQSQSLLCDCGKRRHAKRYNFGCSFCSSPPCPKSYSKNHTFQQNQPYYFYKVETPIWRISSRRTALCRVASREAALFQCIMSDIWYGVILIIYKPYCRISWVTMIVHFTVQVDLPRAAKISTPAWTTPRAPPWAPPPPPPRSSASGRSGKESRRDSQSRENTGCYSCWCICRFVCALPKLRKHTGFASVWEARRRRPKARRAWTRSAHGHPPPRLPMPRQVVVCWLSLLLLLLLLLALLLRSILTNINYQYSY